MVALLISHDIVSDSYYRIAKHPIMSFKTIEIKMAPVSAKWSFELSEIDGREERERGMRS